MDKQDLGPFSEGYVVDQTIILVGPTGRYRIEIVCVVKEGPAEYAAHYYREVDRVWKAITDVGYVAASDATSATSQALGFLGLAVMDGRIL